MSEYRGQSVEYEFFCNHGICHFKFFCCSNHLFLNHPEYDVGMLTQQRQLLVKNQHLIALAGPLHLHDFLVRKHLKTGFTEYSDSRFLSNCMEAVLGAVFLDGGLHEVDALFARLAFQEKVRTGLRSICDEYRVCGLWHSQMGSV